MKPAFLLLFLAAALPVAPAGAQAYPSRPIRFIVPFAPGGPNDVLARLVGVRLHEQWGQAVVIENRGGASGVVAAETVIKAAPDGLTLLSISGSLWTLPLMQSVPYDPVADLAPVTLAVSSPNILVVNPALPVKSVRQLIALAKARPGALNYSTAGAGSSGHLSAELFKSMAGVDIVRVAYKGGAPSVIALMAGETQLTITTVLLGLPQVKSGRLRGVAVTSMKRSSVIPETPTVDESGVKGYDSNAWYALLAPARTAPEIVTRWNQVVASVVRANDMRERLLQQGAEPAAGAPDELDKLVRDDIADYMGECQAWDAGIGVLLVEHHTDFVFRICDRVTTLNVGKMIKHGSPDEVQRDPEVIRVYLGA